LLTLESKQRSFAENTIDDILFKASLGTLYRDSNKILKSRVLYRTGCGHKKRDLYLTTLCLNV